MVIVGDVSDPYAPIPQQCWLVDVSDDTSKVEAALDLIEQIHGEKKEEVDRLKKTEEKANSGPGFNKDVAAAAAAKFQDCACGAAIASAYEALKEIGGRIILVQSSLPTIGAGILPNREQTKLYATDMEREMWTFQQDNPAAMFYKVRFFLAVAICWPQATASTCIMCSSLTAFCFPPLSKRTSVKNAPVLKYRWTSSSQRLFSQMSPQSAVSPR